ncbi:MAG: F0F1 ATP synthase subunit epsilon [Caldilineaceae bacterium]|nr:F0F1 ATP synthase subunit epsilon [Caldilineaceae bacterium]
MGIKVDIVTPERLLISQEVSMVTLPGADGQMGVMAGHAPLLTTLDIGEIILHGEGEPVYLAVGGGVAEVRPDKVTILADTAEHADEIDLERAEAARERARVSLEENPPVHHRVVIESALRRSNLRLKVARRRRVPRRDAPHFDNDIG